jgi:hypothetical protein
VIGTRSNFIIAADRIRRCLIAWCCAGNVIAMRISGAANFGQGVGVGVAKRKSRKLL